jgi:hypothetical protein
MRSLGPEQLVLLLIFLLLPLLNLLLGWLQRRARARKRPEPEPREEPVSSGLPPRARVIEPVLGGARRAEGPRATPPTPPPARRRTAPLGGPAAIRGAIVAMTILGPCRGLEEPPRPPGP